MSKVDAMRALREARLSAAPAPAAKARVAAADGPCGHRSMNGRSCTRESGHAEKNHRYG